MKKHFETYGTLYLVIFVTFVIGLILNDQFWAWLTSKL